MPLVYARYSRCRNGARVNVGLSVEIIGVTVSISSNKVRVEVVFTKNVVRRVTN